MGWVRFRSVSGASETDDPLSRAAIDQSSRALGSPAKAADHPEQVLRTALDQAPASGLTILELIDATGMGRTWIYDRLQALAATGRARQVTRGRWRA